MFDIIVIVNKKYNYSISYHFIIGSISLLRLKKLERLDLGSNVFCLSIIQSLRLLKSLKTLSLHDNNLEGSFPAKGMPIHLNTHKVYKQFVLFTSFSLPFFFFFGRTFGFWRLGDVGFKLQWTQWLPNNSR